MARDSGKGTFARDADGQMMLLAAVILVVGFIALAGMVARVGQLGTQTGREQDRALVIELAPMHAGLDDAIQKLLTSGAFNTRSEANKTLYEGAILGVLEHMRILEASRGFAMEYRLACATANDPTTGYAAVSLTDGELWVQVRSTTFVRPAAAASCTPAPVLLPP